MTDKAYAATPAETLEQHIMDSRIAKSEAEWWASRTIEALRAENARLRELLKECADDMEAEYKAKYGFVEGDLPHPVERRLYERDMMLVRAARKAMGETE